MLDRLLRPKRVATFGGEPAARVVDQLDAFGFDGDVWPVHPSRDALGGRPALRSVDELPGAPDVAFVAVPRAAAVPIVRALRDRGAGGVVVYSSGFAESGDGGLQAELVDAAAGMPLLGPNTYGYVNALDGTAIWPDVHGLRRVERGVAIVTQSGNIGINLTMARRGLDVGIVVTAGNQANLGLPQLVEALLDDPRVTAIGLQFEWVTDGQALGRAAQRAAHQGTRLVALRVGTSHRGALVTSSHTGAMAGEDDAYDALFRRYGVARARTIPGFLEALKLAPLVKGRPRVVSLSASGGEAAHVADLAHAAGVDLPEFSPGQAAAVRATVGELVAVSNPMDYHTFSWGDGVRQQRTFRAAVAGFDLALLVLDFPLGEPPEAWWAACRAFAAALDGIPGLVVASLPETMPETVVARIRELGLVPMLGVAETIDAIAALTRDGDGAAATLHLSGRPLVGPPATLDEAASKALLAGMGVPVPAGVTTRDPFARPVSYPVTVKVLGIDHKADAGAVAVGVPDATELRRVIAAMPRGDGYLLEETITGGVAELLASVRTVDGLGWMLTIGAGGSLVEAFDDRAHLLVPATADQVLAAIRALRIAAALRKRHAGPAGDVDALVEVVMALQSIASRDGRVIEAEVNPLIVRADGVVAADAMITVVGDAAPPAVPP